MVYIQLEQRSVSFNTFLVTCPGVTSESFVTGCEEFGFAARLVEQSSSYLKPYQLLEENSYWFALLFLQLGLSYWNAF